MARENVHFSDFTKFFFLFLQNHVPATPTCRERIRYQHQEEGQYVAEGVMHGY